MSNCFKHTADAAHVIIRTVEQHLTDLSRVYDVVVTDNNANQIVLPCYSAKDAAILAEGIRELIEKRTTQTAAIV